MYNRFRIYSVHQRIRESLIDPFPYHRFSRNSLLPLAETAERHRGKQHINEKEHQENPGDNFPRTDLDLLNPARKNRIQDLDPEHCRHTPEKAEQKIDPPRQIKGDAAVVPEHRSEYQFRKYTAAILIYAAYHRSKRKIYRSSLCR